MGNAIARERYWFAKNHPTGGREGGRERGERESVNNVDSWQKKVNNVSV